MNPKTIIYISGIDGCGKTTQATELVESLKAEGYSVNYQWLRWEPSIVNSLKFIKKLLGKNARQTSSAAANNEKADSRWSNIKKQLMRSKSFRYIWLKYACSDYYRAYKKAIKKWDADVIIMDRYIFDFIVDQAINFNFTIEEMQNTLKTSKISEMHSPEHNIIINIPAKVGYERKMDGTSVSYLEQRQSLYNSLSGDVLHLDGTTSIDEIKINIYDWVSERIRG